MSKVIITSVLLILLISGCKEDVEPIPSGLTTFEFASPSVGDSYLIRVHLPESFNASSTYPVLYQLDGRTTTGSVIKSYNSLQRRGEIEEVIIVTIDYIGRDERERDFTPTSHPEFDDSGGAANFLQFLTDELVPHIDNEYPTDVEFGNTLRGHSFGGLFAAFAMFEGNTTFRNYIIESPSWWWDDNFAIGQEFEYAQENNDLEVNTYFAVGEFEGATMKGSFEIIRDRLISRNYPNFTAQFEILSKQDHLDVRENANGLKVIFGR